MKPVVVKVGRITVALGLIIFGITLLLDNFAGSREYLTWVYKLWPLLLVGFGAEYLTRSVLAQRQPEDTQPQALRFDLGGAFLLALVVLLSAGISTFRYWVDEAQVGRFPFVSIGGQSVSRQDVREVRLGAARELRIDVGAGSVRLEQHNSPDQIRVEATYTAHGFVVDSETVLRELDQISLKVTEGDTVTVRAEIPRGLVNVSVSLHVFAPPGLKVRAETGAGSIRVTTYQGDLDLRSGAGSINVGAGSGTLSTSSGAGQITVAQFEGPVSVKASVGSLHLENVFGALQADTGTGGITIRNFQGGKLVAETRTGSLNVSTGATLAGDLLLKTSAGSISLDLPKESSMRVTAQTRAGSLTVPDFMNTSGTGPARSGVGATGDGKNTVTLETGTGSIHFTTH